VRKKPRDNLKLSKYIGEERVDASGLIRLHSNLPPSSFSSSPPSPLELLTPALTLWSVMSCQQNIDLPHVYRCLVRFPGRRRPGDSSTYRLGILVESISFYNKAAKVNAGRLQVPQPGSLVGSRIHLGNGRSWSRRRVIALKDLSCRGF
jgi:hypothetical protein